MEVTRLINFNNLRILKVENNNHSFQQFVMFTFSQNERNNPALKTDMN